jgi:hypothetical protein
MELANDHTILNDRWVTEVNVYLATGRCAAYANLACAVVLIDPATFLMPPRWVVCL